MGKIQGIPKLLEYLEQKRHPMTEEQIEQLLSQRTIPHARPYGDMILFDENHIDWWIEEQRKTDKSVMD
ncbi:hypothetical protein KQ939_11330 [Planococcus sp. CP5-4]|uniref:hypothetical protein n=1 Tax=unclassified Planococcus (in: firmicutes) TaxID=2662419 RepID=UPI001C23D6AA|nr:MULTISPECIES: hypothetical protein [unclassified Planococcus (in: firmicutes)]MBU9672522.1 hypothetical protein [Planococcus sp. CP5-4_YE]MBV0909572.1 hypothetical protein [Planococcus sp. CP5-4_UN]MBW6064302.1 hypothetical protein [Planococcus sp. CP5-4]